MDRKCLSDQEQIQGLFTLLMFYTLQVCQVLFHTCNAHGVHLSELFTGPKALILSDQMAPMPLILDFYILPKKAKNLAFELRSFCP